MEKPADRRRAMMKRIDQLAKRMSYAAAVTQVMSEWVAYYKPMR